MFQLPDQPQSFSLVIKNAIHLWLHSASQWWSLTLILIFISSLPIFLLPEFNTLDPHAALRAIEDHIYLAPIFYLVMVFVFGAIISRLELYMNDDHKGFIHAMQISVKRFPMALLTAICYSAIVLIGLAFYIYPGIIFSILFGMAMPLVILEGASPLMAFEESFMMISKHWWHTFVVLFIVLAVYYVLATLIFLGTSGVWEITHPSGGKLWLLQNVLRVILSTLFYPLFCAVLIVLLHDLKIRMAFEPKPIGSS